MTNEKRIDDFYHLDLGIDYYENRIRSLQEHICSLRADRRVLMSLLERMQDAEDAEKERLARENRRLRQQLLLSRRGDAKGDLIKIVEQRTSK